MAHTYLSPTEFDTLRQGAQNIAALAHPGIVHLLEFNLQGRTPYLVGEYAPGGSLRQQHPRGTRLPIEQVVFYVDQIAEALQYAHVKGIIHRDIKPDNILIGQNAEILLSDFGIAIISQHTGALQSPAGSAHYMAPEQIDGHPRRASDQYALAIMAYEWLAGEPTVTPPGDPIPYIVRSGDSLWSIAQSFYNNGNQWPISYNMNQQTIGPNPNSIYVGMNLLIP